MSSDAEKDVIFTLRELAAYLKVNPRTIHRLLSEGGLPGFRVGHAWRFRRESVDAWTRAGGSPSDAEGSGSHG
jgi:excisionase family DNA binding protein